MKVIKDMALTRKMFLDTLPRALGSDDYALEGDEVMLHAGGGVVHIAFRETPSLALGGFRVPRAQVTLEFSGFGDDEAKDRLKRFERYFHRGGG